MAKSEENLCIRTTPMVAYQHVRLPATCFKDLVRHSNVFVDKSLLVKSILEKESVISLTYPPKWGKSVDLDMLKTFLQREVDLDGYSIPVEETWSYNFFKLGQILNYDRSIEKLNKPPLIAQHADIIEQYLAKYPVIYVNLSMIEPLTHNFEGFFNAFKKTISTVCKNHLYIRSVLQKIIDSNSSVPSTSLQKLKSILERFEKYLNQTEDNPEEMVCCLNYLSRMLNWHFKQKVFVFVDNYDAWIQNVYLKIREISAPRAEKVYNFYVSFMNKTFANNDSLRNGISTGTLGFKICFPHTSLSHVIDYNLHDKNISPFFGFTAQEVEQLSDHLRISHITIGEVNHWYGGYKLHDFPDMNIFNPWSVVNCVNNGVIDYFWRNDTEFNFVPQVVKFKTVRNVLERLTCKNEIVHIDRRSLELKSSCVSDSFSKVASILFKADGLLGNDTSEMIWTLLFTHGYLTLENSRQRTVRIRIQLPNEEIKNEILKVLKFYVRYFISTISDSGEKVTNLLIQFMESNERASRLKTKLEKDLNQLRYDISSTSYLSEVNTRRIHPVPFMISLFAKFNFDDDICWSVSHSEDESTLEKFTLHKRDKQVDFVLSDLYNKELHLQIECQEDTRSIPNNESSALGRTQLYIISSSH